MNCKPGDLCVVVAEYAGCEKNIGVMLTVVRAIGDSRWEFKDATRPVKVVDVDDGTVAYCLSSYDDPRYDVWVEDRHLVPVRPDDLEDETPTVRELEAA